MSRRKRSNKITTAPPTGITTAAKPGRPAPATQPPRRLLSTVVLVLVVALAGALLANRLGWFAASSKGEPRGDDKAKAKVKVTGQDPISATLAEMIRQGQLRGDQPGWRPGPWQPTSAADQVIDRYRRLNAAGDAKALELLGGRPLTDGEVVPEKDVETRRTDTYLRGGLKVTGVWPGEPDARGRQMATPGRYTLQTRGVGKIHVVLRENEASSSLNAVDPELVVDVKDGKIVGVRTTLAR